MRSRERWLALGEHLTDDALLFSDVEGRPWRPDVYTNRFARLRAELCLDRARLHDLRHFVATVLGGAGVPIATISGCLGHRDNATTLNLYTHALPATDQVAADRLRCRSGRRDLQPRSVASQDRWTRDRRSHEPRSEEHTLAGSPPGNLRRPGRVPVARDRPLLVVDGADPGPFRELQPAGSA